MTRSMEKHVRWLLKIATFLLIAGVLAVGSLILRFQTERLPAELASPPLNAAKKQSAPEPAVNPMISKLAGLRMSKAVAVKAQVPVKPAAPKLSLLVRVKGILDFGDPASSEVIVESMRSNSTKNYKVGEPINGVAATVVKIDSLVTFKYDGAEVQLGPRAEA